MKQTKVVLQVLNAEGLKTVNVGGFGDPHGAMSWLEQRGFERYRRQSIWFKNGVRTIGTSTEGNIECGGGYVSAEITTNQSDENFTAIEFRPILT